MATKHPCARKMSTPARYNRRVGHTLRGMHRLCTLSKIFLNEATRANVAKIHDATSPPTCTNLGSNCSHRIPLSLLGNHAQMGWWLHGKSNTSNKTTACGTSASEPTLSGKSSVPPDRPRYPAVILGRILGQIHRTRSACWGRANAPSFFGLHTTENNQADPVC